MDNNIFNSRSISELQNGMGLGEPVHPLITIIDAAKLSLMGKS